jgi:peptidoglycan/xylan/chitin deacetylase (PgdA/CDA1 family)
VFVRSVKKKLKALHALLPPVVAGVASRMDYVLASRLAVHRDPRHPPHGLPKGVLTLSLDFELAWAWVYAKYPGLDSVAVGLHEREQVPKILRVFDEFGIPATWATVGHLFLRECRRNHQGLAHADMARLPHFENAEWKFLNGDWFDPDPCTSVDRDPAWYAPDLVDKILNARAKQEIGCHAFSHAGFGAYCPPEVAAAELEACREAMKPYGLTPRSFVFPGNDEGNFQALAAHGVRSVRAFPHARANLSLPVRRPDGLWAVPASSGLSRGDTWSMAQRLARLKRFVDAAAREHLSMHLWLHPSLPTRDLTELLTPFLRHCAELRECGQLDVLTMDQLVDATDAAESPQVGHGRP